MYVRSTVLRIEHILVYTYIIAAERSRLCLVPRSRQLPGDKWWNLAHVRSTVQYPQPLANDSDKMGKHTEKYKHKHRLTWRLPRHEGPHYLPLVAPSSLAHWIVPFDLRRSTTWTQSYGHGEFSCWVLLPRLDTASRRLAQRLHEWSHRGVGGEGESIAWY